MLAPFPVVLAEYDAEWPKRASEYASGLQALGPTLLTVHHIGSTSVPGLAAKPIIDLMPVVTGLDDLDRLRHRVTALGYQWHGELGIAGRRYCVLINESGARMAQLHFFEANSPHVARHIAFRDYLRAHPETAREYEREKRRAQKLHANDSHAYTDEKAAWIKQMEAQALLWAASARDRAVSSIP